MREAFGVSQEDVAKRIGCSHSAYSKWEQGISVPDLRWMISLAKVFGVEVDYFFVKPERPLPKSKRGRKKKK
jgi:transcriptional regulator with XRE-family HTH domain